ncbi:protein translocase subunit SecD [Pelagibacterium sp. 26DY04]|uniref:protein translocase subunit SecD n=1 Tax=Pelagibacterium sp. 26DY04 TaxID=2967130 RepID=UPI0028162CD6|nr:protein translocase subunit SecD [Pelagibacterium sp. 26DY04]WMT88782.1 protein translocase subunit SecD [Pelagibacterium sp. 26DY04]
MKSSPFRLIAVVLVTLVSMLAVLPNFLSDQTVAGMPDFLPKGEIVLGLDLQGGSHLLLEVNRNDIVEGRISDIRREARTLLIDAGIGSIITTNGATLDVELTDPSQLDAAREVLSPLERMLEGALFQTGTTPETQITTSGGRIQITLTEDAISSRMSSLVAQSLEVIRSRIDEVGTTEPIIQRQGDNRILVQVPGFGDSERLKDLISQTARLTFHLVYPSMTAAQAETQGLPAGTMIVPSADGFDELLYEDVALGGEQLVDAQPAFDQNGQAVVSFRFNTQGALTFGEITSENVGRRFAIVLDNEVITAPTIQQPITGGTGQISGTFTPDTASDLAVLLRAGALPATLDVVEERTVGPSLGADSINAGVTAGVIGTVGVVLFMFAAYGLFGLFANIALVINVGMILAALSTLGATLTLPGIAGIVLTIGMAVDANVLIFERIREELANGRSAVQAIDSGFKRAMMTIVDANVTTLIAAVVLFFLGSGPVQGFAVTLAIGVLTTMFTAYLVTQVLVNLWFSRRRPKTLKVNVLERLLPLEPKIPFMKWRKVGFAFTLVLLVGTGILEVTRGLNLGIDFTGGSSIELQATDGEADIADLRSRLGSLGIGEVQVQEFGTPADVLVRIGAQEGDETAQQAAVQQVIDTVADEYEVRRTEAVSGTVSGELAFNGIVGILVAMVGIVIYVWLRFEWQFSVGAILALVHDVVLTVGLFALLRIEFNLSSIAAVLTVIGYSLNDTVVIYDRIRENLSKYKKVSLADIINMSLNQTLARTVLTGGTTALALLALVFFGGEVIRSFTLAMAWGVLVGTYSSIFVSAPILLYLGIKTRAETEAEKPKSERRADGAAV